MYCLLATMKARAVRIRSYPAHVNSEGVLLWEWLLRTKGP